LILANRFIFVADYPLIFLLAWLFLSCQNTDLY
jgi:hypothetical protein